MSLSASDIKILDDAILNGITNSNDLLQNYKDIVTELKKGTEEDWINSLGNIRDLYNDITEEIQKLGYDTNSEIDDVLE